MGTQVNSTITPATGAGGAATPGFQHEGGRVTFIGSPNGRMGIARHEAAAQCREIAGKMIEKVPAGRLDLCGTTNAYECGTKPHHDQLTTPAYS